MQVRLFGELEAEQAGVPVPVHGAKQRALLALLALRPGQPVSADQLIDAVWGDGQAANPVNALQAQIGQLRRTLGASAVITSDAGYALDIGPDDVDAARFEHLVAKGRRLLEEGETALASTALGEALRLRRGEPLTEFAYAGFADAERAHLAELTPVAIETRVEADLVLGRHGELAGELEITPEIAEYQQRFSRLISHRVPFCGAGRAFQLALTPGAAEKFAAAPGSLAIPTWPAPAAGSPEATGSESSSP